MTCKNVLPNCKNKATEDCRANCLLISCHASAREINWCGYLCPVATSLPSFLLVFGLFLCFWCALFGTRFMNPRCCWGQYGYLSLGAFDAVEMKNTRKKKKEHNFSLGRGRRPAYHFCSVRTRDIVRILLSALYLSHSICCIVFVYPLPPVLT